jgi:hypothetical protein
MVSKTRSYRYVGFLYGFFALRGLALSPPALSFG